MGLANKSVYILFFLILFQLVKYSQSKAHLQSLTNEFSLQSSLINYYYETIDTLEDFNNLNWEAHPPFAYAQSSAELPGELAGQLGLEGEGILYFEGIAANINQGIFKRHVSYTEPGQFYIKYYIHFNNQTAGPAERNAYALPALVPDEFIVKYLPATNGFEWEEIVMPVDMPMAGILGVELGTIYFQPGDFLLIEKFAFIQGQLMSLEEIRDLFQNSSKIESDIIPNPSLIEDRHVRQLRGPRPSVEPTIHLKR